MLKLIAKLFKALNSNVNSAELAHAFSCGFVLGFMPKNNLLWYLVFVFILFIKINKPLYLITVLIGSSVAPFMDSYFDTIGYEFLTIPQLAPYFARLIEIPFVGFSKFNNTVVIGSLLSGLILYVPLYFLGKLVVFIWRKFFAGKIKNMKVTKLFYKIPLVSKVRELMEAE